MVTTIRILPFANPDSVGLPSIVPSADEVALYNHPALRFWFRASDGFSAEGWRCKKTNALAAPINGINLPTRQTMSEYNGQHALVFGTASAAGAMSAAGLFPTGGDYSSVVVGRAGPGDNAYLLSDGKVTGSCYLQHLGTGVFVMNTAGQSGFSGLDSYTRVYSNGPNILLGSFSAADDQQVLRANRGRAEWVSAQGITNIPNDSRLTIGARGKPGVYNADWDGAIDGGDLAECLGFNVPLHKDITLRNLVERVLGSRYGITAP